MTAQRCDDLLFECLRGRGRNPDCLGAAAENRELSVTKVLRAPGVLKDFDLNSVASYIHQRTNSGHIFPATQKASRMLI